MRARFQAVVGEMVDNDDRFVLLLGDIGVYGFRDVMARNPTRVLNMGILEQAMTSFAAGIAISGKIPIIHTIAPFLVERPYEQIKVDFGYQRLTGKFFSVGGSFEYAALGATHHGPGDVAALLAVPGFEIFLPSSSAEADFLIRKHLATKHLSYFRIVESEYQDLLIDAGAVSPQLILKGSTAVMVAFGPAVEESMHVARELGLSLLYVNEISKSSVERLNDLLSSDTCSSVILTQPFYEGTVVHLLLRGLRGKDVLDIGVPRRFIHEYGSTQDLKLSVGLDVNALLSRVKEFINVQ